MKKKALSPRRTKKILPPASKWPATLETERRRWPSHLHALHHHQLFHQGLCLACQVHGALEQEQRVDRGEARFVRLLRVHRQHSGDAAGTDTQGTVSGELGKVGEEMKAEELGPDATSAHPSPGPFPAPLTTALGARYLLMSVPHCSAWLRSWGLLRLARISPSFKRECSMAVQEAGGEKETQNMTGSSRGRDWSQTPGLWSPLGTQNHARRLPLRVTGRLGAWGSMHCF